jgi:ATP-dependent helicase/DNAse subunit B
MHLERGSQQFFTFAETNFNGAELVPSLFWLDGREESKVSLSELNKWPNSAWEQSLSQPNSPSPEDEEILVPLPSEFSLSPGTLKNYALCPFVFFAEKGLKLEDPAVIDLDLEPRTRGTIQHRLLEILLNEPFDPKHALENIPAKVEQCLSENEQWFFSQPSKEVTRKQLEEFAERYLDYEIQYRKEYPNFYTFAQEVSFKQEMNINGTRIVFRGKIDRIDVSRDHKFAVVIDYKNDVASLHHANKWFDQIEYQLPAYVYGVEKGLTVSQEKKILPAIPVVAAHYLGLKDFSRKGFTLDETPDGIVECPSSTAKISQKDKEEILNRFNSVLFETAQNILKGQFSANPHPIAKCPDCAWRNVCRAKNQNS